MTGFNLNKVKRQFLKMLEESFSKREAEQMMRIVLDDLFGLDLKTELMKPELRIDEVEYAILKDAVDQLLKGIPVQYVTRKAWFDGLLFYVDKSVLIPRPETEGLVQLVAEELARRTAGSGEATVERPLRIWDVGTGSGCIAIALAKRFPNMEVVAFDVSEKALVTAKMNVLINGVNVELVCDDVLHPQSEVWQQPVDLVVSNPPYVRESEKAAMERNVLDHEPHLALFVPDDDPLLFYRQIFTLAKPQLNPQGSVWFEINETLGDEMLQLAKEMGFEAKLHKDFAEKLRFVSIVME